MSPESKTLFSNARADARKGTPPFFIFGDMYLRYVSPSSLTNPAAVDRIIHHLGLTFAATKPPLAPVVGQVALMAAEESEEYE